MSELKSRLLALDFDGVVCDSAAETAVAAWRAARLVWPETAAAGDDEPAPAFVRRFMGLRPLIETGWQTAILARLIFLEADDAVVAARFAGEADALRESVGLSREELVQLFGGVRDSWIAADTAGWLARHRFYPGVAAAMTAALTRAPNGVVILTTKQERFTRLLLEHAGVPLPPERVYGLERGRPKEDWLAEFASQHPGGAAALTLVEDRLNTLQRVAARLELAAVRLYLADWGYLAPDDRARAAALPRIRPLTLATFCPALATGTL
jgi:phosphoglycolate phosphatase-like HAD superfamily hydrolase